MVVPSMGLRVGEWCFTMLDAEVGPDEMLAKHCFHSLGAAEATRSFKCLTLKMVALHEFCDAAKETRNMKSSSL
ncbi:hypothetical protein RHGRI_001006 [Rhododendron griersonianum]|uniref:Uncharacterized protein n=1 Tax=Rhododendron griersonianum TaxID=479676 RepID=A0AAV6LLS0_9ERIC|nr:hypothetical protein RHGRI_001006 [Rhododendron griersonianum]